MPNIKLNSGFKNTYIMHHIDWELVPESVKKDLIRIYRDFKKQYKPSLPTPASLKKAVNLLKKQYSKKLTVAKKNALKNLQRMPWLNKLCLDAANEYKIAACTMLGTQVLDIDIKIWYSAGKIIYLDHLLRHPYKVATIQKLSKLRNKARKSAGLPKDGNVGF